jgi:hypothetical protein
MSNNNEDNILAFLGGASADCQSLKEKLKQDQQIQNKLPTSETAPRLTASLPIEGVEYEYERDNKKHIYTALKDAAKFTDTQSHPRPDVSANTIQKSLYYIEKLASHKSSNINIDNINAVGKTLAEYAENKTSEELKKSPEFNHAYAIFCAAQHQAVADYHKAHVEMFRGQGDNEMADLAEANMKVALQDAAINMSIAQKWEQKISVGMGTQRRDSGVSLHSVDSGHRNGTGVSGISVNESSTDHAAPLSVGDGAPKMRAASTDGAPKIPTPDNKRSQDINTAPAAKPTFINTPAHDAEAPKATPAVANPTAEQHNVSTTPPPPPPLPTNPMFGQPKQVAEKATEIKQTLLKNPPLYIRSNIPPSQDRTPGTPGNRRSM